MNESLKMQVVPILRNEGFKGSFPHFRRSRAEFIDIIGFQFSSWSPQFYVEIALAPIEGITLLDGQFFPPEKVKHYHTGLRRRIGPPGFGFDYSNENYSAVSETVIASLDQAKIWWDQKRKNNHI